MLIDREKVVSSFNNYLKGYDHNDPRIGLKIAHTYRVATLCETIANHLKFNKEEVELAWLIGMLHDVGRFDQVKRYGTFKDADSMNHAQYGTEILFDKGYIRNYIESNCYDELICAAILNHNLFVLPNDLDVRTRLFSDLIRDADKIDILKLSASGSLETIYGYTIEQMKQAAITKEVIESYLEHKAVDYSLKKSPIDHVVGHVSLAFELVFPISFEIVEKQGYLNQILSFDSENEMTKIQLMELKKDMQKYIIMRSGN
ncbi:MAG: HD domain-containing protein [Lachnotalea sp.]